MLLTHLGPDLQLGYFGLALPTAGRQAGRQQSAAHCRCPRAKPKPPSRGRGRERRLLGTPLGPSETKGAFCATHFQSAHCLHLGVHSQRQSGSMHVQTGSTSSDGIFY